MKQLYIFATLTELFGIVLTSAGLVYELTTGADFGFVVITAGSIFIAIGSLVFAKVMPWVREESSEIKK